MAKRSNDQKKPSDRGYIQDSSVDAAVADLFKKGNMDDIYKDMKRKSNEWRHVPIQIGILGSSGSGKSTLINTLRGITNDLEMAAPVGFEETTTALFPFNHTDNDNFVLWDIPGVGTKKFPRATYLQDIGFDRYDFFIICSSGRFSENDIWLATEIQKSGKNFYMLRTKLDNDIRDAKRDKPSTFNETDVMDSIRRKYRKDLDKNYKLFLISSIHPTEWDFPVFEQTLVDDCPAEKKESLILSLKTHSRKAIEQKRDVLRERIHVVSLASAAAGAVPIPGVSAAVNLGIIKEEFEFYKKQLGLKDDTINMLATSSGMTIEQFAANLNLITIYSVAQAFIRNILGSVSSDVLKLSAITTLPIVGTVLSAFLSYAGTKYTLRQVLDKTCKDAFTVFDYESKKQLAKL